jgi:hypothetical protein
MARRSGNPNWCRGGDLVQSRPARPTAFEMKVLELGLPKEAWVSSLQLQDWCSENRNRCYVPESLLEAWRMGVDPNL